MENPDTVIELHRTVVEQMFTDRLPPQSIPPQPFQGEGLLVGEVHLHVAVSRVWFHVDANARPWRQRDGATTTDLDRHLGFDLRLGEHPPELGLENSTLVVTGGVVPVPSGPPRTCNGRQILFNEIPLFGRLVIHDSLERVDTTIDGRPHQDVVIDFAQQQGHTLEADPSGPGFNSEMFGPDVQQLGAGRVRLTGTEPHVVWELTPAEQECINQSILGEHMRALGFDPIDTVAAELAKGVVAKLATLGDNGTSSASLLPEPIPVDPTGESGDPIQIDGVVRLWTRQGGSDAEESLQVQIQTIPPLADGTFVSLPEPLPASVLAFCPDETVGFMRAGFAILRSIRAGQISSLCLEESDFDPDAGCLLAEPVGMEIDGEDATLAEFSATIEPNADLGHDVLNIRGYAEGETWYSGWFIEFGLVFCLDRGEVPRDPLEGEDLQPTRTLAEMNARLRELAADKCDGGDRDAIEDEQKQIAEEKNALPAEIGVKPQLFGEPFKRSDGWVTTLGALAGIAAVVGLAIGGLAFVAAASVSVAFTAGAVTAAFLIGYGVSIISLAVLDDVYIDCKVSDNLDKFVDDKSRRGGDSLPLEGYSPTTVILQDGVLRVFLAPLPRRLSVRFFEPDRRGPMGDPDYVSQQIAGLMPDGRLWRLTVADAAHLIEKDRITMVIDPSVTPGGQEIPIHVAHSSRGRRYLRTLGDDDPTNNLASLPTIPSV